MCFMAVPQIIKRWGIHVECMVVVLPRSLVTLTHCHFNLFSPLLVAQIFIMRFPTMEFWGFQWKKQRTSLNQSLSVPNDPELLPYEVSNTGSDLKDVKKKELEKNEVKKKEVKDQNVSSCLTCCILIGRLESYLVC